MRAARLILTVCFSTLMLSACSEKESDKIADAQNCLDNATAATASACVSKVDGISTPGAFLIRCVGKFVEEGLNQPARLKSAMEAIDNGGGANQSLTMMTVLAFKSVVGNKQANKTNAQQAFSFCNQSNSKGLILLSSLAQTSTTVAALAVGIPDIANMTPADLDQAMDNVKNDPEAQAAVGEAAVAVYNSSCQNGQSGTGDFCTQFAAAIDANGGSTNGIGQFIMNCYANPGSMGCDGF